MLLISFYTLKEAGKNKMLRVDISDLQKSHRVPKRFVKKIAQEIFKQLTEKFSFLAEHKVVEVSLVFTDDQKIQELNKKYRHKDRPTDVLSFPFQSEEKDFYLLGEIIISTETAFVNAEEYGLSFIEELTNLIIHGFVHLLDLDHEKSKEEEREFKKIESDIFKSREIACEIKKIHQGK